MVPMDDQVGVGGSRRRDLLNPLPGCVIILPAGSDGFHVDPAPPAVSPFDAEINRFRRRAQARLVQKLIRRTEIVENLSGSAQLVRVVDHRPKVVGFSPAQDRHLKALRHGAGVRKSAVVSQARQQFRSNLGDQLGPPAKRLETRGLSALKAPR